MARDTELFLGGLASPERVQAELLLERIVRANAESDYGRRHGFAKCATVRDYRAAVPIVDYEAIAPEVERISRGEPGILTTEPVRRFFATSGSTARAKLIPVTSTFIGDKARAFGIYWGQVFAAHPEAEYGRVVGNFSDSGGGYKLPSGLPVSAESAYWAMVGAATQRRGKSPLPKCVGQIERSDARYYTVARILLEEDVTLLMALNPSTILLLLRKLSIHAEALIRDVERGGLGTEFDVGAEARAHVESTYRGNPSRAEALRALLRAPADPGTGPSSASRATSGSLLNPNTPRLLASEVWSRLALVVSWRSPMQSPYLRALDVHLGSVPQRDYLLMASEAVMAIPLEDGRSGGVLATPFTFFEFIPEEELDRPQPTPRLAHELETGRTYVLVLSTTAGLYRYNIGDVVRVTGFREQTPVVEFLHRAGATCSLTGEKLTEDQVAQAVQEVASAEGLALEDFTLLPAQDGFPRYRLLAELTEDVPRARLERVVRALDDALAAKNIEYGAKRRSERLDPPELWLVARGAYAARRAQRIREGANDAQIKPIHLTRDAGLADQFEIVERLHAR